MGFNQEIIDINNKQKSLIESKKQEIILRLKSIGIDLNSTDLKTLEKNLAGIEKICFSKAKITTEFEDVHVTKDGLIKPLLTEKNIDTLLESHQFKCVFDEIKNNIYIYDKNEEIKPIQEVSSFLEDEIQKHDFKSTNFEILSRKIERISHKNKLNPVKDYILESYEKYKDLDLKTEEIDKLFTTIKGRPEDKEHNYRLFKTWMISTVSCMFNPDFKSQGALTFTGPQGLGKSTWFSNLVPEKLREYFKEEFALNTIEKDNYMESVQYWIVELSELGRTVKDSDRAKSHITKKYDEYRAPYERNRSKHKRTTVYGASVDKDEFLRDDVNRRWWIIKVLKRFDLINLDHSKLYAELYNLYLENPKKCHELDWTGIQDLNNHNEEFNVVNDADSCVRNLFDWESDERYLVPTCDISDLINNSKIDNSKIGRAFSKMGVPSIIKNKSTKQKLYYVPIPRKIKVEEREKFLKQEYALVINYEKTERKGIKNG